MARPKKSEVDEIAAVDKDIEVQTAKLKKLKEKQKRLQEADNIRIGKLIKSVFKDTLPSTPAEQKEFFISLAKKVDSLDNEVVSNTQYPTEDVTHNTPVTPVSGAVMTDSSVGV